MFDAIRNRILLLLALAVSIAAPASAQVELGREGKLSELLLPVDGQAACFVRGYDAAHLKRHPQQKVTNLRLKIEYHQDYGYLFQISAELRSPNRTLYASGACRQRDQKVLCGVECDGGEMFVEPIGKTGRVMVGFEDASSHLRMTEGCDDEDNHWADLEPREDDWRFSLGKTHPSVCGGMTILGK